MKRAVTPSRRLRSHTEHVFYVFSRTCLLARLSRPFLVHSLWPVLITTPSECATLKGQCKWQANIKYQSNLLLKRHAHSEGGPLLLSSCVKLFKSEVISSHPCDVYFEDVTKGSDNKISKNRECLHWLWSDQNRTFENTNQYRWQVFFTDPVKTFLNLNLLLDWWVLNYGNKVLAK